MGYRSLVYIAVLGVLSACGFSGPEIRTHTYTLRDARVVEVDGRAQLKLVTTTDLSFRCPLSEVEFKVDPNVAGTSAMVTASSYDGYPASEYARRVLLLVKNENQRLLWENVKNSYYQPRDIEPR